MVQIIKLFTPVKSMEADEARDYIAQHQEGDYLILDVRQPGEYEEAHIPGAKLLPLPELPNSYKTLDPEKPTIIHCAIGGRSRVAAQMLSGLGFKEVYNLAGGIKAYQGQKAAGPQELNLDLVRGDETPTEITSLACGMERTLQLFYETMPGPDAGYGTQRPFRAAGPGGGTPPAKVAGALSATGTGRAGGGCLFGQCDLRDSGRRLQPKGIHGGQ